MKDFLHALKALNWKKLFYETTDNVIFQMFRYLFVGGIAFVADAGSLYLLTSLGVYYLISTGIAFVFGLIVNYILSKLFIFKKEQVDINPALEFVTYSVIGVVGLGLTELLMYVFTSLCGIYFMASKIIVSIIVLIWNFAGRKMILYRRK